MILSSSRSSGLARGLAFATLLVAALLQGCATTNKDADGGEAAARSPADPWEGWNRKVFSFNESVDQAVLKPVAITYTEVVPKFMRTGVNNFFGNFGDAWSAVNNLLQGKGEQGFNSIMRVGTNTVFGVFGLFDVATEAGIERHTEDFGQTLGVWGLPPGPYLVWPLLGPSDLRDTAALPLDMSVGPTAALRHDTHAQWGVSLLQLVRVRANLLGTTNVLDDIALDRYTFVRDAYLQRRRSLVYDGEPPDEPQDKQNDADGASATASEAAPSPAPKP